MACGWSLGDNDLTVCFSLLPVVGRLLVVLFMRVPLALFGFRRSGAALCHFFDPAMMCRHWLWALISLAILAIPTFSVSRLRCFVTLILIWRLATMYSQHLAMEDRVSALQSAGGSTVLDGEDPGRQDISSLDASCFQNCSSVEMFYVCA